MKKTRKEFMGKKTPYEKPMVEQVIVLSEGLLYPRSWNAGDGEGNMPIIEGDYDFGDDDDGKGAKFFDLWEDDSDNGSDSNVWN